MQPGMAKPVRRKRHVAHQASIHAPRRCADRRRVRLILRMLDKPLHESSSAHIMVVQCNGWQFASTIDILRWVHAGVQLGVEVAESDAWPLPPQPCGVIAGTRSLSAVNPTSWLTSTFRMLQGEALTGRATTSSAGG